MPNPFPAASSRSSGQALGQATDGLQSRCRCWMLSAVQLDGFMIRVFVSTLLFSIAALPLAKPAAVAAETKPNIVIIVADDLGWGPTSASTRKPHPDAAS
ncbi:MAG: hypothetical protein CM1200mP34_4050 [Verrucomicrobiales bacterium]|nr:MAG: hypothetical protein CM1200mP34_4050 [Verrucomicrobiales bacterium]